MPEETLIQGLNGKWSLTIKHGGPSGLIVPATFTYNGNSVDFEIKNTETTIDTDWETELGTEIELTAITRSYSPTIFEEIKYIVTNDSFEVHPYNVITHELKITPSALTIPWSGTGQLTAIYSTYRNGIFVESADVSTQAVWTYPMSSQVFISGGTVTGNNTAQSPLNISVTASYNDCTSNEAAVIISGKEAQKYLRASASTTQFDSTGGSLVITIESNTQWSILSGNNGDWIIQQRIIGTGDSAVTISIPANQSSSQRSGTIIISGNMIITPVDITISQSGAAPQPYLEASLSPDSVTSTSPQTPLLEISCNTIWTVSVSGGSGWVTVPEPTGSGDCSQFITVADNTGSTRIAYITVTAPSCPAQTFTLTQTKAIFLEAELDRDFIDCGYQDVELEISCNTTWNIVCQDCDWIIFAELSGNGNFTQTLSVYGNSSASQRVAEITVNGEDGLSTTVTLRQDGALEESCTFNFIFEDVGYFSNQGSGDITLEDSGSHDSFTATAATYPEQYINAGFNGTITQMASEVPIGVTGGEYLPVEFSYNDTKGLWIKYEFQGNNPAVAQISATVTFNRESGGSVAVDVIDINQGGQSIFVDLSSWYVPNDSVNVRISFDFIAQ